MNMTWQICDTQDTQAICNQSIRLLVVCGRSQIWDHRPALSPVAVTTIATTGDRNAISKATVASFQGFDQIRSFFSKNASLSATIQHGLSPSGLRAPVRRYGQLAFDPH